MKCSICSSTNLKQDLSAFDFDDFKKYRLMHCLYCQAVHTYPRPSKGKLRKKYSTYREEVKGTRFNFVLDSVIAFWHNRRVKNINYLYPQRGKILDIGCGRGVELKIFKKQGWEVKGTELSQNYFSDIPVISKEIWQLKDPPSHYNAIMFLHSLEHLRFPGRALKSANELLKPQGILTIAVPNYGSLERKIFGSSWFHLDLPRHITHFNIKFFENWAKKNNFKIIKVNPVAPEYDFYSVLQGSLNLLPYFPKNLLYNLLLKKNKNSLSQKVLFVIQIPFILMFSVSWIIIPILWLTSQSGTIELYLKKSK